MTNNNQPTTNSEEPTLSERIAALQDLRTPFPSESILQKPGAGGMMLDYVSHAHVTERLLAVDPLWTWEPAAFDAEGLPQLARDKAGNAIGLWIRLTVCGTTRLGYGSCASNARDGVKELIGDAIRNAAMRFGVALDQWKREPLPNAPDQQRNGSQSYSNSSNHRPPASNGQGRNGQSHNGQTSNGQAANNQPTALQLLTRWCASQNFCVAKDNKVYPQDVMKMLTEEGWKSSVTEGNLDRAKQLIERRYTHNKSDSRQVAAEQLSQGAQGHTA